MGRNPARRGLTTLNLEKLALGVIVRWSIRNQILLPILAFQAVAVTAIALTTAALAVTRSEDQIVARLNGVVEALTHFNFPFTDAILERMHGLSGAHFVAYDANGRMTARSGLTSVDQSFPSVPRVEHVLTFNSLPLLRVDGESYVAVALTSSTTTAGQTLLVLYPQNSLLAARREAVWPSLALGAGTLGVLIGLTSWIAQRISARIGRVENQVARIAEGDFRELDPGSNNDEIRDLARSVNRMAADLVAMRNEIRQTTQARLLAQLAAGLAHQLRNSLTGARMSVQLHTRRCRLADDDASLAVALRQLELTEDQVKGILTLGRLEESPHVPCHLNHILSDVATLVDLSARHVGVSLEVIEEKPGIEILADPAGLRAAFLNLALNAIDAAGARGRVVLGTRVENHIAMLEVSDSGQGPPPSLAEQDRLFDAFTSSKPEGVGLGLALARQVAEDHKGRLVWERDGRETRFRIEIPIASVTNLKPLVSGLPHE